MEMLTLIAALLLATSSLFAPCAASSDQAHYLQKSLDKNVRRDAEFSTNLPSLPRKLKLNEEETVHNYADKDLLPHKKVTNPSSSGTKQHEYEETAIFAAEKGTTRERAEEEGSNKSEYFTMDYGWVRRRRPIHNKHVPFLP